MSRRVVLVGKEFGGKEAVVNYWDWNLLIMVQVEFQVLGFLFGWRNWRCPYTSKHLWMGGLGVFGPPSISWGWGVWDVLGWGHWCIPWTSQHPNSWWGSVLLHVFSTPKSLAWVDVSLGLHPTPDPHVTWCVTTWCRPQGGPPFRMVVKWGEMTPVTHA